MRRNTIFNMAIALSIIILFFGCNNRVDSCFLTNAEAIKNIKQINRLLDERSPYMNINNSRVLSSLDSLIMELNETDKIDKIDFTFRLKEIFAELGDRHSWVRYFGDCSNENEYFLPFAIAPWKDDKVIALVKKPKLTFSFYLNDFPFLTSINNQGIKEFIDQHDPQNKYAPKFSKHALGVEKLNEFYKIKRGLNVGDEMKFTFTSWDFKSDTTLFLSLVESKNKWREIDSYLFYEKNDDKNNQLLFRQYKDHVAYIKIPEMYNRSENKDYFKWLQRTMDTVKTSKALIIDIRNNPGGNRDLINFFSNYLIPPNELFVANLAKYRGEISNDTKENLNSRKLYLYSDFKDNESKKTIDSFMRNFHPSIETSKELFSDYHYMIIKNNNNPDSYFYNKQVFILTNEMTYSAASVFASSFKGMRNIKIVGTSTDGSSGLSKTYTLKNSGIQLNLSHMLSFQKNGKLFDGIGTSPDIEIHRSINQIFGNEDYQLKTLLKVINEKKLGKESNNED